MSAPPYMQLYVADYTADVQALTCEQDGAYWRLLRAMWRAEGKLPNVPAKLALIVGLPLDRWTKISPDVLELFVRRGGVLTHKRITSELVKSGAKSAARSEAGKRGGSAKANKNKDQGIAIATILPQQKPSILEPEPEPEPERIEPTVANASVPEWQRMLVEAKDAIGEAGDFTRPAMHHARDLKALVEPSSGEPCTWDEVIDAIRMVAIRQTAKRKPIPSWQWVQADAWALRDKRLNAAAPSVADIAQHRSTGPPPGASFTAQRSAEQAEVHRRVMESENG